MKGHLLIFTLLGSDALSLPHYSMIAAVCSIIGTIIITVGSYHLLFFLQRREAKLNLWVFFIGAWQGVTLFFPLAVSIMPERVVVLFFRWLAFFIYPGLNIFFLLYLYYYFDEVLTHRKKILLLALALLPALIVLLIPVFSREVLFIAYQVLMGIQYALILMYTAYNAFFYRQIRGARLLFLAFLVLNASCIADCLIQAGAALLPVPRFVILYPAGALAGFIIMSVLVGVKYYDYIEYITGIDVRRVFGRRPPAAPMPRGIDADAVIGRLLCLLDDEKIFLDEDITLVRLAAMLSIPPHQLSRLLNVSMNTNFYTLINMRRVDEAKGILSAEPESSIISVAYRVGFNTVSSFYKEFRKHTGARPMDFKKSR